MNDLSRKIGVICYRKGKGERELSFLEILLDERVLEGDIYIKKEAFSAAGGINDRLEAKQNYELVLRAAKKYGVILSGVRPKGEWIKLENKEEDIEKGLKTDCYLIGRYKKELLECNCFNDAVTGILSASGGELQSFLEQMISGGREYYEIYDATQPVLIYAGDDICYSVLDTFARNFGEALREKGQCVEYFDTAKRNFKEVAYYANRRFKAIIGMQTFLFSVKMKDGRFVHDEIAGRKYNFVFDHPVWFRNHLTDTPKGLCVLTPDRNYADFVKRYYGVEACFFPPAGTELCSRQESEEVAEYDISFLGTCGSGFQGKLKEMLEENRQQRLIMNRFLFFMQRDINQTAESAFRRALEYYHIVCSDEEFLDRFHKVRWMIYAISQHYRNRVISSLLEAGINLHVFGESWKNSAFYGKRNLICHEEMLGEESLNVFKKSRLSLNVMSWHKDGFTERIANAMLQHSVVVTDKTRYLEENFVDGEELLMFDLREIKYLPKRVKTLLGNPEKIEGMAERAYRKVKHFHTWNRRAEEFLRLL